MLITCMMYFVLLINDFKYTARKGNLCDFVLLINTKYGCNLGCSQIAITAIG